MLSGAYSASELIILILLPRMRMHAWTSQDGRDTADLGVLLLTFLMRYGRSFDYDRHAVSVGQGGVIPRADLANPIPAGHIVQLIVEDVDTKRCANADLKPGCLLCCVRRALLPSRRLLSVFRAILRPDSPYTMGRAASPSP